VLFPKPIDSINAFIEHLRPCPKRIYNLGGAISLFLAHRESPFFMVEVEDAQAESLLGDILFWKICLGQRPDVFYLPTPDSASSSGMRARVSYELSKRKVSVVGSRDSVKAPLWAKDSLERYIIYLSKSGTLDRESLEDRLREMGYESVSIVSAPGQYSLRKWVFDIYPSSSAPPIRVELFGDSIESIKRLDIEGQRSLEELDDIVIFPSREPEFGNDLISALDGVEVFAGEAIIGEMPEGTISLTRFAIEGEGLDAGVISLRGLGILADERKDIGSLPLALSAVIDKTRVMLISSSEWQAERLKGILKEGGLIAPIISPNDALSYEGSVFITIGGLSAGFYIPGLMVITEGELFKRPPYRPMRRSKVLSLMASIDDLKAGDYVVHKDYGIGRFTGLVRQSIEGYECDLMAIEYAEGARLYVPLDGIDKVGKYHFSEGSTPRLDTLGGRSWLRTKERVRKKVKELADRLLRLYAEREITKGFVFSQDTEIHREFDSFFLYEETPDQLRAIEEIKSDMASDRPMDRLLCGDVGYGKTEVAMRAAFRAVYDGKQVAVIVPTTLLCEQHTRTFKSRFSAFPVRIDYLSRFKDKKESAKTIKALESGDIDIIIGTHALLRKGLTFQNLGLLIIDEEHRFGVAQKERIKELKKGVDVLTLSATPIPRTLQMALSGIRAMSLIETPPEDRLAVKTTVAVFSEKIIRDAILNEVERAGQVFFVHNRIKDIEKISDYIKKLFPELRISVAHGRTPERELEKIMLNYIDGKIDVLVSTAIIGSGLDIPNSNTIIVNMAERMGLADLYQLKGRVGRGREKGYAYFLISEPRGLTEEASKRLQAIQELSYLGAGLRLAMKDLEIRGAGNLLGPEQSGYMEAVGFDMYMELLEEAVLEVKGQRLPEVREPKITLSISASIPDDYIEDMMLRLSFYRKIALSQSTERLSEIRDELRDRFGPLPEEAERLLSVAKIKLRLRHLPVESIVQSGRRIRFSFVSGLGISAERLLEGFGRDIRFYPDGFEIIQKEDIIKDISNALDIVESIFKKEEVHSE